MAGFREYGNEQMSFIKKKKKGEFCGLMTDCQLLGKDCGPHSQGCIARAPTARLLSVRPEGLLLSLREISVCHHQEANR